MHKKVLVDVKHGAYWQNNEQNNKNNKINYFLRVHDKFDFKRHHKIILEVLKKGALLSSQGYA